MMLAYIDVGVVRIQEYLLRTSGADERQLRKRRGASRMVAEATCPQNFPSLKRNEESYHVEGVVHLRSHGAVDATEAAQLAREAARVMRGKLPQAYIKVSWALAESYQVAYSLLSEARAGGTRTGQSGSFDVLPALREDPFAGQCDSCGGPAQVGGQCEDCAMRDDSGAAQSSAASLTPEARTAQAVAARVKKPLEPVKDLLSLARLVTDPAAKHNHLATVHADGNGVGRLFQGITNREAASEVSLAIDEAIRGAGEDAIEDLLTCCHTRYLPAVVSVLAADDAVITVPAPLGWRFTTTLIEAFARRISDSEISERLAVGTESPPPVPSLSAGIVFAHMKTPIETVIQRAHTALTSAKQHHQGSAAVGWADLTHAAAAATPPVSWSWLDGRKELLNFIAALPGSQQAQWERDLHDAAAMELPEEDVTQFFIAQWQRLGFEPLIEAAPSPAELSMMLNITRWWAPPCAKNRKAAL